MRTAIASIVLVLGLGAPPVLAQESPPPQPPAVSAEAPRPPEPSGAPPSPPAQPPEPPAQLPQATQAPAPAGQWVFTQQYGWVWIPYADQYTSVGPGGTVAYAYVYYPTFGWTWVLAPWIFGWGPAPFWGVHGVVGFGWHAHPWFHVGHYWGPGTWGGRVRHGRIVVAPHEYHPASRDHGHGGYHQPAPRHRDYGGHGHGGSGGHGHGGRHGGHR